MEQTNAITVNLEELMKRLTPEEIEREGGGSSWWYVCPECHGSVDAGDRFCKHCVQALTNGSGRKYLHPDQHKGKQVR